MNNKTWIVSGIVGIAIGLLLYPALFRPSPMGMDMMGRYSGGGNMMEANIDRHFIEQMIPHHEGAIEMAKLALEKAKRPEVLTLANGIIKAQEKEIVDMKKWYSDWFGSAVPQTSGHMMGEGMMMGGTMHMSGMAGDLEALGTAADFDREFVEQMIPHHEMAVMMAEMLERATTRPEMKQLAQNIITSQTSEIQMMREWLEAWK